MYIPRPSARPPVRKEDDLLNILVVHNPTIGLALFLGPTQLSVAFIMEGTGIFSHVNDVRIERMVEWV